MSLNQWVVLKHDHVIQDRNGDVVKTVPEGQLGRLAEVHEDGDLYVAFPQAHTAVKLTDLLPVPHPTVEQALDLLRDFHGHHCNTDSHYQFDIKMRHFPPEETIKRFGDGPTQEVYNDILENDLSEFMNHDYGIVKLIDWVGQKWHTAGRSGGWLVIHDTKARDWESLKYDYEQHSKELEDKQIMLSDIKYIRECRDLVYNDIMELAIGIRYIGECVRISKHETGVYVENPQTYESLIDDAEEDEDYEQDYPDECGWDADDSKIDTSSVASVKYPKENHIHLDLGLYRSGA